MKVNCQIWGVDSLVREVANQNAGIRAKVDSCYLKDDGTLHLVMWDEGAGMFSIEREYTPNELAEMVNMPLWEVVKVDNGGFDDFAILFYEED